MLCVLKMYWTVKLKGAPLTFVDARLFENLLLDHVLQSNHCLLQNYPINIEK